VIDGLASASHYRDHLGAVLDALPPAVRGSISSTTEASDDPILVASYGDMIRARDAGRTRIALMEHGAGQSYGGRSVRHGSYAGGMNRGAANLFLHPGMHPANRDRAAYPAARVEVVGSPYLDTLPTREGKPGRVVAFTFHFNGAVCPETKTAYPAFFPAIVKLAERYEMLGTAHPMLWRKGRSGRQIADRYRQYGIEPVENFADICRRADVLIADNTSAMFAFAATGRPVVVMNAPWYDRRVNHGLRFWDASEVGVNCDDPATLGDCIEKALADAPEQQQDREEALSLVYAYRSGASQRAADVLMDWAA
jgi:CDP-glycerol:poly(glycerophosphate) glycerophosphotransferase